MEIPHYMGSVLDTEGTGETAGRGRDTASAEDRKVDLVVRELEYHDSKVAALWETEWMGKEVYHVRVRDTTGIVPSAGRPIQDQSSEGKTWQI